jgi:hypothetical protein
VPSGFHRAAAVGQCKDEITGAGGHIWAMPFDLNCSETTALVGLLRQAIDGDRYQFSLCVMVLKEIVGKFLPEPERPAPLRPGSPLPSHFRGTEAVAAFNLPARVGHLFGVSL